MDDDRIERRAEQIRAEQRRRREEYLRERESMREQWGIVKEFCSASLGDLRFEMPSREWLAKAKWTLRSELSRRLNEATNERAEVAEPFMPDPIWLDGPPPGDFGVWFYKEMLGRVVRAHVLNIQIHESQEESACFTMVLGQRIASLPASERELNLADVLDAATDAAVEAMAQSVAAGCRLLAANPGRFTGFA